MLIFLVLHIANTLCVNTTNVKHPLKAEVRSNILPFCMEHNTRTCCDPSSALTIYKKFYRTFNDPQYMMTMKGTLMRACSILKERCVLSAMEICKVYVEAKGLLQGCVWICATSGLVLVKTITLCLIQKILSSALAAV